MHIQGIEMIEMGMDCLRPLPFLVGVTQMINNNNNPRTLHIKRGRGINGGQTGISEWLSSFSTMPFPKFQQGFPQKDAT